MDEKKQPTTLVEKVKKTSGRKKARIGVVLVFIVLLVIATISNVGFKGFEVVRWIADALMLICIMVFGLLIGESGGGDKYREDPKGIFQVCLRKYREARDLIKSKFNYFPQWYRQFLPKQLEEKKMLFLISEDVEPDKAELIVKYATADDLHSLFNEKSTEVIDPVTKEKHYIRKIGKEQQLAVETVLKGEIKLDSNNSNYFLEEFDEGGNKTVLAEEGNVLRGKIRSNKKWNRITKIIFTLAISLLWASLTVYELMAGDSLQTWLNLFSRISALCTSLLSGFLSASTTVKLEARIFNNKTIVLNMFEDDLKKGVYVGKTDEEIAKAIFEEEQRLKEEAKKNVIDPLKDKDKVEIVMEEPKRIQNKRN